MLALYLGMIETPEEKTAFEDLYNKYRGKMFSLAYSILKNYPNAEEAVSQAFFTIARNFSKIRDLSPVKQGAYLKITVKNAAIDIYRKETGENSTPIEEIEDFTAAPDDVSDEVLSEMNYNKIVEAIRSLPEQYGECLYLFHVRELSIKEIAAHLYIEPEAVKKRLQRARQKLRKILEENEITI